MEMILEFNGLQHWDAVLALLEVTHTAYLVKKEMISQIKLLLRLAAGTLQLLIALSFQIHSGVAQLLMLIKPLPRTCVLVKLLHAVNNP
jgi:hypothetical protein